MKFRILIFCFVFFILNNAMAQQKGNAKLYAYMQPVSPGVSPNGEIFPDGTTINSTALPRANYFLYISYNSTSAKIYPTELWINGQRFGVKYEAIEKKPVIKSFYNPAGGNDKEVTLVPKTNSKVLMLTMTPLVEGKKSTLPAFIKKNAVVVVYKYLGKLYYTTIPQIKKLDQAYMQ